MTTLTSPRCVSTRRVASASTSASTTCRLLRVFFFVLSCSFSSLASTLSCCLGNKHSQSMFVVQRPTRMSVFVLITTNHNQCRLGNFQSCCIDCCRTHMLVIIFLFAFTWIASLLILFLGARLKVTTLDRVIKVCLSLRKVEAS